MVRRREPHAAERNGGPNSFDIAVLHRIRTRVQVPIARRLLREFRAAHGAAGETGF
jgi:hypothetical protein